MSNFKRINLLSSKKNKNKILFKELIRGFNVKYISKLKTHFKNFEEKNNEITFSINSEKIILNSETKIWRINKFEQFDHKRIFDLNSDENWSVLMLVFSLFKKGYKKTDIYLEKKWKLGHNSTGYIDLVVYKNDKPWYFFEVKTISELNEYINFQNKNKTKQLFSYLFQEKNAKIGSYYSYNFSTNKHLFLNVFLNDVLTKSYSLDDMYEKWNKSWNKTPYILNNNKFDIVLKPIKFSDLEKIDNYSVKTIFNQFLTILRQNSVSDKSNAFDKMINLFIAKVYDEFKENSNFDVNGHKVHGLKFQFISNVDDNLSFLKRINDLYKSGMEAYMNKEIIDYSDKYINEILSKSENNEKIKEIIDNLRLKKNNSFSFIEVFDDKTFYENNKILIEIVKLMENYRFKYNNKHQYLGDFFEELLNTSWKQEAGQFFTPMPLVEFIVNSLPIEEKMIENIQNKNEKIVPKMIDYASGSGHFLISYMDKIQSIINNLDVVSTNKINKIIETYRINQFSWANHAVVGIEKDYRLAKTTKISGFLNGDGEALIINGDGINKFNSKEYINTPLYTEKQENNSFDFVITNPPYSVGGFMKNVYANSITKQDFELLDGLNEKSKEIEILFVERTKQLLKEGGMAALVLPRSILTATQYSKTRDFILREFKILSIFESADITFSGTTTSPIILFLKKQKTKKLDYDLLIINSPKMLFKSTKEEKEFLGYEFSSNKNKLGIKIKNNNLSKNYAPVLKKFILNSENISTENMFSKNIQDILVKDKNNKHNLIYTKNKIKDKNCVRLKDIIDDFNPKLEHGEAKPKYYLEISDITNGEVKLKNTKTKSTTKIANKGDILLSSMPNSTKIAIADKKYFVSSAIFVIRINDIKIRDNFYNYIYKNKNNIINDMNVFLDGFKITYGKINEFNLKNNIFLNKKDIYENKTKP